MIKVAPSILSADFAKLGAEVEEIRLGGADYVHFDVMDGCFVPNISIGIPVLKSLRKATEMFIDAHLMIVKPIRFAEAFCKGGADLVNVHVEADSEENIFAALAAMADLVSAMVTSIQRSARSGKSVGSRSSPVRRQRRFFPLLRRWT